MFAHYGSFQIGKCDTLNALPRVRTLRVARYLLRMVMIKTHYICLASLIALSLVSLPTHLAAELGAVTKHGATFTGHVSTNDLELTLSGVGVLKYHGMLKLYVAGLYVDMSAPDFASAAKRLEVHYLVNAKAKRFNSAGERILKRSMDGPSYERIEDRLAYFGRLYPDSRKGDRCAIFWQSGSPIQLSYNGAMLGNAAGDDFANAYFDIWLGQDPADTRLRKELRTEADKRWPKETK